MVAGVSSVASVSASRPLATMAVLKKLTGANEDVLKKLHAIQPIQEVPEPIKGLADLLAEQMGMIVKLAVIALADYMLKTNILKQI